VGKFEMVAKDLIKFYVTALTAIATAFTPYSFGRSDGKEINQNVVEFYKIKLDETEKLAAAAVGQITSLKLELQKNTDFAKSRESTLVDVARADALINNKNGRGMSVSLEAGQTKNLFDDGLFISLVGINYQSSPPVM
jgi:hypothetical protein